MSVRPQRNILLSFPIAAALIAALTAPAHARPPRVTGAAPMVSEAIDAQVEIGDAFGIAIASVGDVNGDGVTDLAVGAPGDDDGGTDRGALYIVFLSEDGHIANAAKIAAASLDGLSDGDAFGTSVAAIGDVNDDGIADLAVGAPGDDSGGAVWVLLLTAQGTASESRRLDVATLGLAGTIDVDDGFASVVSPAGDLDGDGTVELAVGALGSDLPQINAGNVWILFLEQDLTVSRTQRLGDDDSGFVPQKRSAFGSSLLLRNGELLIVAGGDPTNFAPPVLLRAFNLSSEGKIVAYRVLNPPNDDAPLVDCTAAYGDFNFDGVPDLMSCSGSGLGLFLMAADGVVVGTRVFSPHQPDELPPTLAAATLAVIPDVDGNLLPEIVVGGSGALWLVRLNGESAEGASCGDPTGDGFVTTSDALLVLRRAIGLQFCELLWCDVDASGLVTASDALAVLHEAVGQDEPIMCPTTTTTSTSTVPSTGDQCFHDADCFWDEELDQCCGYHCCECDYGPGDCPEGQVCDNEECVPAP